MERFVRRQAYETLIRLDCRGSAVPVLAQSWTSDDNGHRWTLTLRPNASFSDGVPLTAADVFAALTRDSSLLGSSTITIVGLDRVSVRFPEAFATVPPVFADEAYAVSRPSTVGVWPVGSSPETVDSASGVVTITPRARGDHPTVTVRSSGGSDGRDLLDHGIDILVTDDPEVLSYAGGRGDLANTPLPWDRVYVLVSPTPVSIGDTLRASLAHDIVRRDARPSQGKYWWAAGPACPAAVADSPTVALPATDSTDAAVVYYADGDAAARGLAERLVALGLIGADGRASGVAGEEFDQRFGAGGAAYLLALPREALAPCRAVTGLAARAPWLSADPGRYITPLVETREHAIVRRGGSAFTVDWDGTLRLR